MPIATRGQRLNMCISCSHGGSSQRPCVIEVQRGVPKKIATQSPMNILRNHVQSTTQFSGGYGIAPIGYTLSTFTNHLPTGMHLQVSHNWNGHPNTQWSRMAHATQILTSHRIQKQQAIVDIDAFGPPKQLGIKPTKNGFYLKHGWDTQTKMLGYAERNGFFW